MQSLECPAKHPPCTHAAICYLIQEESRKVQKNLQIQEESKDPEVIQILEPSACRQPPPLRPPCRLLPPAILHDHAYRSCMPLLRCESERTCLPWHAGRNQSAMMIKSSRVLVLAMLSSASGWGLPSNDTGGVDGARDHRQRRLQNSAEPRFAEPQFPPYFVGGSGSATVSCQPPPPRACTR